MPSVFEMARAIHASPTPPSVTDAYRFGKEYGEVQTVLKIALFVEVFFVVASFLNFYHVLQHGSITAGWVLLGLGGAGLIVTAFFSGALYAAKANSARHLVHKEEWFWNVFSSGERIANSGNDQNILIPAHENPSIVAEYARQYATLSALNAALVASTLCWLVLGCAYPPLFAGLGATLPFTIWLTRKLEQTHTQVNAKLFVDDGQSFTDCLQGCGSFIWSRC